MRFDEMRFNAMRWDAIDDVVNLIFDFDVDVSESEMWSIDCAKVDRKSVV